jgi:hypothetical protein
VGIYIQALIVIVMSYYHIHSYTFYSIYYFILNGLLYIPSILDIYIVNQVGSPQWYQRLLHPYKSQLVHVRTYAAIVHSNMYDPVLKSMQFYRAIKKLVWF